MLQPLACEHPVNLELFPERTVFPAPLELSYQPCWWCICDIAIIYFTQDVVDIFLKDMSPKKQKGTFLENLTEA